MKPTWLYGAMLGFVVGSLTTLTLAFMWGYDAGRQVQREPGVCVVPEL